MALIFHFECTLKRRLQFVSIWTRVVYKCRFWLSSLKQSSHFINSLTRLTLLKITPSYINGSRLFASVRVKGSDCSLRVKSKVPIGSRLQTLQLIQTLQVIQTLQLIQTLQTLQVIHFVIHFIHVNRVASNASNTSTDSNASTDSSHSLRHSFHSCQSRRVVSSFALLRLCPATLSSHSTHSNAYA